MLFLLARTITRTNLWIGRNAAWLIFPLFAALLADVIARYLIGRPTTWTAELAVLIFGVYAIVGGGYLLAVRGHVNVDII
ncbi:MAG: TRAP transporter small permease subunit, partial [Roseinatronobacter sp.]